MSLLRAAARVSCRRGLATHAPFIPHPAQKYTPYVPVDLPDRRWPTKTLRTAPVWVSTDLRDGNQALPNPMNMAQKSRLFQTLLQIGFKEIEVAFPSASDVEFGFVRSLIEDDRVPDDVWLQVLSPCRPELVHRTMQSVSGAKNVIFHLYLGAARIFREVVLRKSPAEIIRLAVQHTALLRDLTDEYAARYGTRFRFNYGVEGFSQAEPAFVLDLCEEVKRTWGKAAAGDDRLSFNLAASVEVAPPNHFADQIEYFSRNISEREKVIVSLHPHNDMGTAVGAAQLGLLAGGERVEGCLLGHGERTGNVDLVTLALNQLTQGIPPHLDFSNLPRILDVMTECTSLPVNPRLPYSGKLAFTAFSGSHQDAIKKGFEEQEKRHEHNRARGEPLRWHIPYLPFDPADVGCSYEALIRVNSQSGKAGVSSVLSHALGLHLPRGLQADAYSLVQQEAERTGAEVAPHTVVRLFRERFHLGRERRCAGAVVLRAYRVTVHAAAAASASAHAHAATASAHAHAASAHCTVDAEIGHGGASRIVRGTGPSAQAALAAALAQYLRIPLVLRGAAEHVVRGKALGDAGKLAAYVRMERAPGPGGGSSGEGGVVWGVGVSSEDETARLRAVVSAANVAIDGDGMRRLRLSRAVETYQRASL